MTQKIINTATWTYGPFDRVDILEDCYAGICGNDRTDYQFSTIGTATVEDVPEGYRPPLTYAELRPSIAAFLKKVDADVDLIYAAKIGNRGPEYDQTRDDAIAFKAAGYTGDVPSSIQSWATAKNWTAQQAADDILATAAYWAQARDIIRQYRLAAKESARNAEGLTALETAQKQWDVFLAGMKVTLDITT